MHRQEFASETSCENQLLALRHPRLAVERVGALLGIGTVGFHNFNLRTFNLRVSNSNKLIVDVFLTRCRISMCQGLGPKKHDEISEIDGNTWALGIGCEGFGGPRHPLRTPSASVMVSLCCPQIPLRFPLGSHYVYRKSTNIHEQSTLKKTLYFCVSSLRRGHANLLCIVPILTDDPRRESRRRAPLFHVMLVLLRCLCIYIYIYTYIYIYIHIHMCIYIYIHTHIRFVRVILAQGPC